MKEKTYELLYDTQAQYDTREGNSGNVTSVTPGVAYISENDKVGYNKTSDTLIVVYKVENTSEPIKIYNADAVKTGLKHVFIDKEECPVSSLTNTYQFQETGLHAIKYRYSNLTSLPASSFTNCTNLVAIRIPDSVTSIGGNAFNHTALTELYIPCSINGDALIEIGSESSHVNVTVAGSINRGANGGGGTYFENLIVLGDVSSSIFASGCNYCKSWRIKGGLLWSGGSNGALFAAGVQTLSFFEVMGDITCTNPIFYLNRLGSERIYHLGYIEKISGSPNAVAMDNAKLLRVYVGDGSSEAHDQEVLNKYLADENWSPYASKLDLWYNYHGEYRQE